MADHTVRIKYTGQQARWNESPVTGRQTTWVKGQTDFVPTEIAKKLSVTGLFVVGDDVPVYARNTFDGVVNGVASTRSIKTALVIGDSITAQSEMALVATSVTDNGDGTATVVRNSHSLGVGDPVRMAACPSENLNVVDSKVVSVIDANKFRIELGGRTHGVTATSGPIIYFPLRRSTRGWFNWMETKIGASIDPTWCAVGGATSAQMLSLLEKTSVSSKRDVAFVCIGMNDIYSAGNSIEVIKSNIKALINEASKKSNRIVLLTVPPRNSADTNWSAAKQSIHNELNRWIYEYGIMIGATVIDTWSAVHGGATYVNAQAVNPDPMADFVHDNTHPSMRGAAAIGFSVAQSLSDEFVRGFKAAHASAIGGSAWNLLPGPDFTAGTNVADGWAVSDTTSGMVVSSSLAARTVENDGDACGKNQLLSISYGTATGNASTRFRCNNIQASLDPGTVVQLRINFSVSGAAGLVGIESVMMGARGTDFWMVYSHQLDSNTAPMVGDFSGCLISPEVVVPSGLTDLDVWVRPYITSAQSSALTLKIWHPELRVVKETAHA